MNTIARLSPIFALFAALAPLHACHESGAYQLELIFPDEDAVSEVKALTVWVLAPGADGCVPLLDGSLGPGDLESRLEVDMVFPTPADQTLAKVPIGTNLFFVQGSSALGIALVRGCTQAEIKADQDTRVVIQLQWACVPGREEERPGDGVDNDCDGLTDECLDDEDCLIDGPCRQGRCQQEHCQVSPRDDGTPCDSSNPCTENATCQSGICQGEPRDCSDLNSGCTVGACDESTGDCIPVQAQDSSECLGADYCEVGRCASGQCYGLAPRNCDDGNPCTLDSCDPEASRCINTLQPLPGQEHDYAGNLCENGLDDDCDTFTDEEDGDCQDACDLVDCDDGLACTIDNCDQGQCEAVPAPDDMLCDDGAFCTIGDRCAQGLCQGTQWDCSDGDECTQDACDEPTSSCQNTLQPDPDQREVCGDGIDQDCDGKVDGCCLDSGEPGFPEFVGLAQLNVVAGLAARDITADGIPDLIITGEGNPNIWVLRGGGAGGHGDGTFTNHWEDEASGVYPYSPQLVDYNRDAILDLIAVDPSAERVSTFLGGGSDGRGDGTFSLHHSHTLDWRADLCAAADFTGDGIIDLVVADAWEDRATFLLGNGQAGVGDGTFTNGAQIDLGSEPESLIAADLNADGILDLIIGTEDLGVLVMPGGGTGGKGDGTFGPPTNYPHAGGTASLAIGDFDDDGIPDLVAGPALGGIQVWLGQGTDGRAEGVLGPPSSFGNLLNSDWVAAADMDNDGIQDIVTIGFSAGMRIRMYKGGGTGGIGDGTFLSVPTWESYASERSGQVALGDFDADAIQDFIVAIRPPSAGQQMDESIWIKRGPGSGARADGTFWPGPAIAVPMQNPRLKVRDANRDGKPDLFLFDQGGQAAGILLGESASGQPMGTFTEAMPTSRLDLPAAMDVGDFDADAIPDAAIIATNPTTRINILLSGGSSGRGDGTQQPRVAYEAGADPSAVVAADLDGDHILDLAVAGGADGLAILAGGGTDGRGDGTFSAHQTLPAVTDSFCLLQADFNSDGIPDLAVGGVQGLKVLAGDGTLGFTQVYDDAPDQSMHALAAGNLNRDGILDLVAAYSPFDQVGVLLGNGGSGHGDGTFTAGQVIPVGQQPASMVLRDLDGDDILDLALGYLSEDFVSVMRGNGTNGRGDGTFGPRVDYPVGGPVGSLGCADFDDDGRLDLVAGIVDAATIRVLFGQGTCE